MKRKLKYQQAGPVQPQYDPFGISNLAPATVGAQPCPPGMTFSSELGKCVPISKGMVYQPSNTFFSQSVPNSTPSAINSPTPGLWTDPDSYRPVPVNPDANTPPDISAQTGYIPSTDGGALNHDKGPTHPTPYPSYRGTNNLGAVVVGAANIIASSLAENRIRSRQNSYYQSKVANPYGGILPYANGLSDDTKYGTVQAKEGGIIMQKGGPTQSEAYHFLFDDDGYDDETPPVKNNDEAYKSLYEMGMPNKAEYKDGEDDKFQDDLQNWKTKYLLSDETPDDETGKQTAMALFNSIMPPTPPTEDGSLANRIGERESGNNYQAQNNVGGGQGAVGKYQFRYDVHKAAIEAVTGVTSKEEFRNNPQAQETYFNYWKDNTLIPTAKYLLPLAQKNNPNITLDDIAYKVHFLGAPEAKNYYRTGKSNVKDAYGTTADTYQQGGQIEDNNGYLTTNLHNFTPTKIIDSNHITTDGMAFPIEANGVHLYPNTGEHYIPGNKVIEKPLMQSGGTPPIYTQDKNDIRLKNYQDSLNAYNFGKNQANNLSQFIGDKNSTGMGFADAKFLENNNLPNSNIKPISDIYYAGYANNDGKFPKTPIYTTTSLTNQDNVIVGIPQYKKPVQPVVYQPQQKGFSYDETFGYLSQHPELKGKDDVFIENKKGSDENGDRYVLNPKYLSKPQPLIQKNTTPFPLLPMGDQSTGIIQPNLPPPTLGPINPKTNFSVEVGPHDARRVQYFPDADSWQQYVDSNPYLSQQINGNRTQAQATMYKGGGWLKGAINPDHKGWCTPLSNPHCTGHRRAFALMMKKKHGFHQEGGCVDCENENLNNNIMKHGGKQHSQPQQGGGQGQQQQMQQIMQVCAQQLQQGVPPQQILQQLVKMGIPQQQAQQIIQQVMQQMQQSQGGQGGGQPQQGQQQQAPQQPQGGDPTDPSQQQSQARMGKYYKR